MFSDDRQVSRRVDPRNFDLAATIPMALVAMIAVVYVAPHTPMLRIGLRFCVAVGAGEDRVIVRIGVAISADAVCVAVVQREPGVIEFPVRPLDGVVTGFARRRKVRGGVVRIVGSQVIRLMTAVTVRGQSLVVVVNVAVFACPRGHGVRACQRESGPAVIEGGVGPLDRVVANLAGLRKARLHMVGIVSVVKVSQVAGDAGRVVQLVIIVDVAVAAGARRDRMRTG